MVDFKRGYIHVYTGDGKGKTTAALGLVLRAAGHGLKSYIIQFMKGNIEYGELKTVKQLGGLVKIKQMGRASFVNKKNPAPKDIQMAQDALKLARDILTKNEFDIVVLDEINVASDFNLISLEDVLELCRTKPINVELILTGRNAHKKVVDIADLVTEMNCVKHYYDNGVGARQGIES
jgi:cob(I)alamin adenosyltransferase